MTKTRPIQQDVMSFQPLRLAVGDVLLKELLSMLGVDARTTAAASGFGGGPSGGGGGGSSRPPTRGGAPPPLSTSQSYSSSSWALVAAGGGGGGGLDAPLRLQLAAARDACQHLTRHLKNVEGLVLALKVRKTCVCVRVAEVGNAHQFFRTHSMDYVSVFTYSPWRMPSRAH